MPSRATAAHSPGLRELQAAQAEGQSSFLSVHLFLLAPNGCGKCTMHPLCRIPPSHPCCPQCAYAYAVQASRYVTYDLLSSCTPARASRSCVGLQVRCRTAHGNRHSQIAWPCHPIFPSLHTCMGKMHPKSDMPMICPSMAPDCRFHFDCASDPTLTPQSAMASAPAIPVRRGSLPAYTRIETHLLHLSANVHRNGRPSKATPP